MTPEFLIWAVEYSCPVRGSQNGSNPERSDKRITVTRVLKDSDVDAIFGKGAPVVAAEAPAPAPAEEPGKSEQSKELRCGQFGV